MFGVVAAPLLLLNRLTLPQTLWLVGSVNIGLGVGLYALSLLMNTKKHRVFKSVLNYNRVIVLILASSFISGLIVLTLEISLFRHLFVLNPASPYNFTLLLLPVLLLLSAGSLIFSRFRVESEQHIMGRIGFLFLFGVITILMGIWGSSSLLEAEYYDSVRKTPVYAVAYYLLLTLPFFFFGGIFPLLLRLAAPQGESLPRETGAVYLASSIGSFVGALSVHFLAFEAIRNRGIISILFISGIITSIVLRAIAYTGKQRLVAMMVSPVVILLFCVPAKAWQIFTYARVAVDTPSNRLDAVEGSTGVATIEWMPNRVQGMLRVNGRLFASVPETPSWLIPSTFALALEERRDVLLLGLGSGTVLREFVEDPQVGRIDVVDWSAELPRLLEQSIRPPMPTPVLHVPGCNRAIPQS